MNESIFKPEITQKLSNLIIPPQYCRLCLSSDDTELKQLFAPFNPQQSIVEVIEDFAQVTILQEDQYSKLICSVCLIKLTETKNFKCLIENSDFTLQNQLNNTCKDPLETSSLANDDRSDVESDHEKIDIKQIDFSNKNDSIESMNDGNTDQDEGIRQVDVAEFIKTEISVLDDHTGEELNQNLIETENKLKQKLGKFKDPLTVKKKRKAKDYNLKCPHCDKIFKGHSSFNRHLVSHTGVYPFQCPFCSKQFATRAELVSHEAKHTGAKNYHCDVCNKFFMRSSTLSNHKKGHRIEKPYKCDQCFKEFKAKRYLQMHIVTHSSNVVESNFVCHICNRTYLTKLHLKAHMYIHKQRELVTCDICGKSVQSYSDHIKVHTKPHKCSICNRGFRKPKMLKAHLVVHTGERQFECDLCLKTFRFKSSLYTHKKTHEPTKTD